MLDAAGVADAVVVCHCAPAAATLLLAADHPERVRGALFMSPALPITPPVPERTGHSFDAELPEYEGWAKANRHYWARDYRGYLEFFFERCFTEPHSTKPFEDSVAWALETDAGDAGAHDGGARPGPRGDRRAHGAGELPPARHAGRRDELIPPDRGAAFAEATGAELVDLDRRRPLPPRAPPGPLQPSCCTTSPSAPTAAPRRPRPGAARSARPRRALFVSSPIGLGHAWRDVAIARELRALHPDLQIDWLAQDPVTRVLETSGEHIHPASRWLANESRHIAAEAREHELNVFQAWRRMDEILLANFMVFHDVVRAEPYDLWIGDEAWELDYYLHENPELKTAPYSFLTDFVGWLPMPEGGDDEARLTADYNAEMIEQIARFPSVRDRAIFVGSAEDVVPARLRGRPARDRAVGAGALRLQRLRPRPGCRRARDAGRSRCAARRAGLRARRGGLPRHRGRLGRRRRAAAPRDRRLPAGARPRAGAAHDRGVRAAHRPRRPCRRTMASSCVTYVDRLSRHLAACDVAVTQGGLTTCMELAAAKRPFVYFPLRRHFEQNLHVRHRLERYGAGRPMDLATATPETIADAIAAALAGGATPAEVERDGAARAARLIADLL